MAKATIHHGPDGTLENSRLKIDGVEVGDIETTPTEYGNEMRFAIGGPDERVSNQLLNAHGPDAARALRAAQVGFHPADLGITVQHPAYRMEPTGTFTDPAPGIHPTASIHPTAKVHPGACILDGAEIGANVQVGRKCFIGRNAVVERDALLDEEVKIGNDCRVGASTVLGEGTCLYDRAQLGPGSAISTDLNTGNDSLLCEDVHAGAGVRIGPGVIIEPGSKIGDRTAISIESVVGPNAEIGQDVRIDNSWVESGVKIGDHSIVEMNSRIKPNTTLGQRCKVAADTVIEADQVFPDGSAIACTPKWGEPGATAPGVVSREADELNIVRGAGRPTGGPATTGQPTGPSQPTDSATSR